MDIGILLKRHALYRPHHAALVVGEQRISFASFNESVNRLANAVLAAGLVKGDKITSVLPNCFELVALYWMAAKTGMVFVPASPLMQGPGLAGLLNNSDTKMVFADSSFADMLDQIADQTPLIAKSRRILVGAEADGFQSYESFVSGASAENPPDAELADNDPYNIMYTSGTTGAPKGIVLTHYTRANYCTQFASACRITPESVILHAGSIVFNGAMIDFMPWMFVGCTYVLHESFDADAVINTIEREKVTHMVLVPTQIIALLNHPGFNAERLHSLEMILSVGAPLHLEHKQKLNTALPGRFYELYGVTEGFMTILDREDALRKVGSVGVPPAFYEMKIMDDKGNECAVGEIGEICGKGPNMMAGYYKQDELTKQTIVDGWLHTGDAGYIDDEGFLYLVDRIKDMIISGGVNVYPKDIEEIIVMHPGVAEAAVLGVPDEKWGEIPIAAVTLLHDIDPAELMAWTNQRVGAKYQRIKDVIVLESFPRNVAGKTLKRKIRENYLEHAKPAP
jgi:long-chain acyl-CoA synthetase